MFPAVICNLQRKSAFNCYAINSVIVFLAVMRGSVRNYGGANLRKTTINDMPVPQGCFKELHAARQRGHNAVLAAGVASLTFAIFLV
jgi:Deltamethrin resistance